MADNMNKTKIDWVDKSWNPITGCLNRCSYCYARKIAMRFTGHFNPEFHVNRITEPSHVKKSSRIFEDSMSDFWGKGVKPEWRLAVYNEMQLCPQHTFFLLTKQPQRISYVKKIPDNCYVGVSITKFKDRWRIGTLISKKIKNTFVSIEPCLDDIISDYIYLCDWIIVGGLTGEKNPFRPKDKTIKEIISTCRRLKKPLFLKNNLGYSKKIQEIETKYQK
jgi:protein gp37